MIPKRKRTENQSHSQIHALKDAIRRETTKEDITTNENRDTDSKAEELLPRSNEHKPLNIL
jgi:hypothetical protein